jgi:hypothetical protein
MRMKPSFPQPGRKPVDTVSARNAALVNQLATPGLGSLMAGRWIAGSGQLALAVAGFIMVVVWFFKVMIQYYGQIGGDAQPQLVGWIGETGGILFVASWFWALVTTISLFFEARRNAQAESSGNIDSTGGPVPPTV